MEYLEGHPDEKWDGELVRRVGAYLVWMSDFTFNSLMEEYNATNNNECLEDMAVLEEVFSELYHALISDMEHGTKH